MRYLTVGSVVKHEESYLQDFVDFHRKVGVEHFVFLDREYDALSLLFRDQADVEVIHFPEVPGNNHTGAWAQLIAMQTGETEWLACIDADQVLVPQQEQDVKVILDRYLDFAAVQPNWHTFGDSDHTIRDPGSLYERFLMRAESDDPISSHTQFICRPDRALPIPATDPHHCRLADGEIAVNTDKREVQGAFSRPNRHDVLWIAHYLTKSREEWMIKNAKGRADVLGAKMPMHFYEEHNAICNQVEELRVRDLWLS